jgi:hypothetical protein
VCAESAAQNQNVCNEVARQRMTGVSNSAAMSRHLMSPKTALHNNIASTFSEFCSCARSPQGVVSSHRCHQAVHSCMLHLSRAIASSQGFRITRKTGRRASHELFDHTHARPSVQCMRTSIFGLRRDHRSAIWPTSGRSSRTCRTRALFRVSGRSSRQGPALQFRWQQRPSRTV